jgi:hypothetical protein
MINYFFELMHALDDFRKRICIDGAYKPMSSDDWYRMEREMKSCAEYCKNKGNERKIMEKNK